MSGARYEGPVRAGCHPLATRIPCHGVWFVTGKTSVSLRHLHYKNNLICRLDELSDKEASICTFMYSI
ncbi:hypothetical protein V6N11_007179 [Hibiscus sabdariffa]|uniref:Uncharacterized protein n=2 Tax=Hibiscus sabdariffa TaxID=183260 RepID=A0ABR2RT73_9ROSI